MIEDSSRIMVVENFYKENNLPFVRRGGGGGGGMEQLLNARQVKGTTLHRHTQHSLV